MTRIKFPQELDEKIDSDPKYEHDFSVFYLKWFLAVIFCILFLPPVYEKILYIPVHSLLSEDGKLSLVKDYEFCQQTGTVEYKQNYFENFLKNVDTNRVDYQELVADVEIGYNLHRYDCDKNFHYREIYPTKRDEFIIENSVYLVPISYVLSIMTPSFLLSLYIKIQERRLLRRLREYEMKEENP